MPKQQSGKPANAAKPKVEYVTTEKFEALETGVNRLIDMLEKGTSSMVGTSNSQPNGPSGDTSTFTVKPEPAVETPAEKEVRKAGPSEVPMNPEWEEMARDIIGEAVDHCEIAYLKNGGVLFTVVIKDTASNAGADYLTYFKSDRRSKEIGQEGVSGVEEWCKLIKSNLARPK